MPHPTVRALFHPSRFKVVKNGRELKVVEGLPESYQKFFKKWKDEDNATPVHWIPRLEKWERNPETGET